MKFNIFKVLEKDDKELIHSSFIKYLLENWGKYFYSNLLNLEHSNFKIPELEKSHDKKRFDIIIESNDNQELILIENKFKSFPYKEQLELYDKILDKYYVNIKQHKILICFDPSIISFSKNDWKIISYKDLLNSIESFLKHEKEIPNEEKIFINHYLEFLNEYYTEYNLQLRNVNSAFIPKKNKKSIFWLRLIYSIIRNQLETKFNDINTNVTFVVNPGNTSTPLINIIPAKWKYNGIETLIQFQGNDVKLYIHSGDKKIVQELINRVHEEINHNEGIIKKLTRREAKSYFIYKEKLTDKLLENSSTEDIIDYLMNFYTRMDKIINK